MPLLSVVEERPSQISALITPVVWKKDAEARISFCLADAIKSACLEPGEGIYYGEQFGPFGLTQLDPSCIAKS